MIRQWVKIRTRDHTGQNHIPWNKNHIPPRRKPRGFSRQSYRSLTGKRQRHSERMWLLNVWDNVPMDLKYVCQQYFTCMCFLGFIRYNKTFIACRLRKNENWFSHEYHIPLGSCPQGIWYSCVNKFSYFPHQHAINVYYYTSYINYHKYINLIRQWVKIRTVLPSGNIILLGE